MMINIQLSVKEQNQLRDLQQNHIHPVIRRRALVVLLRFEATPNDQIIGITGLCENVIIHYIRMYQEGGINSLTELNFRKPQSQLKPFDDLIQKYFEENPVTTIVEACKVVEELTGLTLKNTQMCSYLKKLLPLQNLWVIVGSGNFPS